MISRVPGCFMSLLVVGVVSNEVVMVLVALFRFVESTVETEEWNNCTCSECGGNQGICRTIVSSITCSVVLSCVDAAMFFC